MDILFLFLHEIRKQKANWIGHILRRNCILKQVIEGKIKGQIEVTRRRGRRRQNLVDDLGERRWYSHLKEEALDRIKWRNRFGRDCGPVVWQITDDDYSYRRINFTVGLYKGKWWRKKYPVWTLEGERNIVTNKMAQWGLHNWHSLPKRIKVRERRSM
jgi:hypothetical protein